MSHLTRDQARIRAWALFRTLEATAGRDPEQEVQGIALPVLDACIAAFREAGDDPIAAAVADVISSDAIVEGREPIRAVDAALVVQQLAMALGPEHKLYAF